MRYLHCHSWMRSLALYLTVLSMVCLAQQADYDYGGNDYGSGESTYQDYADPYTQPDNLYADYAATKMEGIASKGKG
jgi:hypothetical protein